MNIDNLLTLIGLLTGAGIALVIIKLDTKAREKRDKR